MKIPDSVSVNSQKDTENRKLGKLEDEAALSWFLIWPVVMFFAAFCLGSLMILFVGENGEGFQPRVTFFAFLTSLVLVCWIFISIAKTRKSMYLRGGASVLRVYMWLGIFVGGLIITAIPDTPTTAVDTQTADTPIIPKLKKESKIDEVLMNIGAKDTDKFATGYVDSKEFDIQLSHQGGEYTYFINPLNGDFLYGELMIKSGLDKETEVTVIAHEYLHHVWATKLEDKTKGNLTSDLITMYGNDPVFRDRMFEYSEKGILNPDELFAYYCTESSDGYLTKYVLRQCNKYIKRSALVINR